MRREVRREVTLPPFSLGMAELELLWERLQPLFGQDGPVSKSIDIELVDEKLTFDSVEDLRSANLKIPRITKFSLYLRSSSGSLMLLTPTIFGAAPSLHITAESEVWAAGVREVVLSIIQQNRAWHSWLKPKTIATLLFSGMTISMFAIAFLNVKEVAVDRSLLLGAAGTLLALAILLFARNRLLPTASLRLSENENFIRKYAVELTLAIALVSAVLTAVGVFWPKSGA